MLLKKIATTIAVSSAVLFLGISSAMADIQISDTYIDFKGKKDFSVTLVNSGASIDSYDIEVLKWQQKSAFFNERGELVPVENIYNLTKGEDGLVVFPAKMVLRQGQTNTVRLRALDEKAKEQNSFRLLLREVDKKYPGNRQSNGQVMLKFSHRIPVFVNHNEKPIDKINFEHKLVKKNGKSYLYVKNLDKQPLYVNDVKQGDKEFPSLGYVFTGIEAYVDITGANLNEPIELKDRSYTKNLMLKSSK